MNSIERLKQYIGKASFSNEADRFSALECLNTVESTIGLTELIGISGLWQPIETAPKDRRILIGRVGYTWVYAALWHSRYKHWSTGPSPMDFFSEPTHWMPSPEGPKE